MMALFCRLFKVGMRLVLGLSIQDARVLGHIGLDMLSRYIQKANMCM